MLNALRKLRIAAELQKFKVSLALVRFIGRSIGEPGQCSKLLNKFGRQLHTGQDASSSFTAGPVLFFQMLSDWEKGLGFIG